MQQRAERRQNAQYYEDAADLFRRALSVGKSSPNEKEGRIVDCHFGLAETLQNLAEGLTAAPDARATRAGERQAAARACQLYEEAVDNYKNVLEDGSMRSDALVNCANALAAWADTTIDATIDSSSSLPGALSVAEALLRQAEEYYNVALAQESDDASTLCNLGDVLFQHASVCHQGGRPDLAWELCTRGQEAYGRACSVSSSEQGDNLPGLLLNWGSGLLTAAAWASTPALLQLSMLDEAISRFRHSISFDRGDVAPHNALGDALVAKAERLTTDGEEGATELLHAALTEGYGGALRIRSSDLDALVGTAEVHMLLAKEATAKTNNSISASHWMAARNAFTAALSRPETLTSVREREEVRYNYVCCLAGGGWIAEAAEELRSLLHSGGLTPEDVNTDPDLAPLRNIVF